MLNNFEQYDIPVLDLGVKLPKFNIEQKYINKYNLPKNCTDFQCLLKLCEEGLNKKIEKNNPQYNKYLERMNYELNILKELDFCSYLLITWDIVNHCTENNIATGYARGSAAGSLVLYLIDVTKIDSLKYGLFFERFLSKTRAKFKIKGGVKYYDGGLLMDIDLDICHTDREKLVTWLEQKYYGRLAKLPTINTLTTKVLTKEVSKSYLEISEEQANHISNSIPTLFGKVHDIDRAIKESEDFKNFAEANPEVIEISRKLYQLVKHFGVHASAWVISADNLEEIIPSQLTKDKKIVTSYTMDDTSNLVIKIDMLGLKCVTLIDKVCQLIDIKMEDINCESNLVYDNLQNLITPKGLFQIEADCNYGVLKKIKPKNIEHLSAIVALARPGTLQFVDNFVKYIETGEFQSVHPFFDDILQDTAGIPVYQESLMRMANKIGLSLEEAEILRRIVGKKKREEMAEWEEKIKKIVKDRGLDPEVGNILWKALDAAKDYSFNKAHAIAYASMSAATIFLKFKYPKEFFLVLLRLASEEQNPIGEIKTIENEMKYFGIKLLGPHLIKSDLDFKIEGDNIRFGISSIKGISDKTLEKLKGFCHVHSNKFNIFNAANDCKIGIAILSSLIHSGCLDDYLTQTRSQTVLEACTYNLLTDREKKRVIDLGAKFNFNLIEIIKYLSKPQEGSDKPFIKESRLNTIRKDFRLYQDIYKQNSKHEELCSYWFERQLLGFSYSYDLINIIKKSYPGVMSISQAKTELNDTKVLVCGEIIEIKSGTSKNKNKYIRTLIGDGTETISCLLMEKKFEYNEELNNGMKLEEGQIVVCEGRKKDDIIFMEKIVNQNVRIITKVSELTKNITDK